MIFLYTLVFMVVVSFGQNLETTNPKDTKKARWFIMVDTIKTRFILNNHNNTKNPYLFSIAYGGLKLFCNLSKNQKRKFKKYGITPKQPNKENLILTNQRIKIKKYSSFKYHKQTREKRPKTYLTINKNLLRCNTITFIPKNSNSLLSREIGLLFKNSMLNHIYISHRSSEFKIKTKIKNIRS